MSAAVTTRQIAAANQIFRTAGSSVDRAFTSLHQSGASRNGDIGTWAPAFFAARAGFHSAGTAAERGAKLLEDLVDSATIEQVRTAARTLQEQAEGMHRDIIPNHTQLHEARETLARVVGELEAHRGSVTPPPAPPSGPPAHAVDAPPRPVIEATPRPVTVEAPTAPIAREASA